MKRALTLALVSLSIAVVLAVSIAACSGGMQSARQSSRHSAPPTTQPPTSSGVVVGQSEEAWIPVAEPSSVGVDIGVITGPSGDSNMLVMPSEAADPGSAWQQGRSRLGTEDRQELFRRRVQPSATPARGSSPSPASVQATLSLDQSLRSTPGCLPPLEEELWVIQVPDEWRAEPDEDVPGSGSLMCMPMDDPRHTTVAWDDPDALIPVPLAHTDVSARIGGMLASTVVTQSFHNPFGSKIEAVYVFPLPQNAAVNEFVMVVGERRIRGIIRKKQEAERIYAEARSRGHVASLLTQQRPNIFTQKVANIEPGKAIDVEITYLHTLPYRDGSLEYVFPMVVGPRFNPPSIGTDGIGASPRNTQSQQSTNVTYLAPSERSGHDVGVTIDIDAGVPIRQLRSKHHAIERQQVDGRTAKIRLANHDTVPNKDFVLQLDVGGEMTTSGVMAWDDGEGGGYFAAMLMPPAELASLPRRPMELVFVLDCSGSMSGTPIEQAKAAIKRGLDLLEPTDTFQVIRFSNDASGLGAEPLEASRSNLRQAKRYVNGLHGSGGTMMIEGIKAALGYQASEDRQRYVVFLTDGYIGNESEILSEMAARMGASRVFSMGVGSSPNRYLMERMAKIGRGAVAYLGARDNARDTMDTFFETVSRPALAAATLDLGPNVTEVYPSGAQDLFVGRPVVITGRYTGDAPAAARFRGHAGGDVVDAPVEVRRVTDTTWGRGLQTVWARGKIADLMDRSLSEPLHNLPGLVERIALDHSLMSAFTAFVAVDSSRVTEGSHGTTVAVPVPVPEGVRYETTVGGGG